jgi:serine phosphatase RsbU (regulator of sigma subunit)
MGTRSGPALGLFLGAEYETSRRKLSPRDVVLLFTDGLFEVEGSGGLLYDYEKLSKAVGDRTVLRPHPGIQGRVPRPPRIVDRTGDNPRASTLKLTEQTLL